MKKKKKTTSNPPTHCDAHTRMVSERRKVAEQREISNVYVYIYNHIVYIHIQIKE